MKHLEDGLMRRLIDEPEDVAVTARRHIESCALCGDRYRSIAANAHAAGVAFALDAADVDLAMAWRRAAQQRAVSAVAAKTARASFVNVNGALVKPLAALAAAAIVLAGFAFTPLGSMAQSFLTIFEPRQFVAVGLTRQDMKDLGGLEGLQSYGTMRELVRPQNIAVADVRSAARISRMELRVPTIMPVDVPRDIRYRVMTQGAAAFTFGAAKAARAAAQQHRAYRAMPARLDGTTLQIVLGPATVITFGERALSKDAGQRRSDEDALPAGLVIAQGVAPRVTSTGATVQDIVAFLAEQPGVPAGLARQIEAIRDPSTTLPIPIPIDRASAMQVQVQGVNALAIGDNTRVGSGVMWQKSGMVYGVAGTMPLNEILAIADSLR
ncbi:MAG: hypothetical protein GIW99_03910 [Candidatus Eremiobacteraeota bacterium]|nr:hypothetical protein [Candidatus Eremiobacteraeota bacterium]MBC5826818.1 hypothetical protein [Candidatus Eremiobacteraeota bacterium]